MSRAPAGALVAAALLASGCAAVREAFTAPPAGTPSGREGYLTYAVAGLRFDAPAAWRPSGSERHVTLTAPDGGARLEVSTPDAPFPSQAACLADAEQVLKRGDGMERVRRHPTTFAGARALTLEGDAGGWHVWAWAACDGGTEYQVFFTARTPPPQEVVEAYRALTASAKIGGEA